jgi:hypothetical protein
MSYLTRKVSRRMKRSLGDGEQVLHAAPAARLGGVREYTSGLLGNSGVPWMVVASRIGSGGTGNFDPRATDSLVPLPQRCTVAVTGLRLLVFSNSFFTNKPSKLVYEVPRAHIDWIGAPIADPGLLSKTERVVIGVRGPAVVGWEVPRLYLRQERALLAELAQQEGLAQQQESKPPD